MKNMMSKDILKEHYKPLLNSSGDGLTVKARLRPTQVEAESADVEEGVRQALAYLERAHLKSRSKSPSDTTTTDDKDQNRPG